MLDFSQVAAPAGDGEVLVLPEPRACTAAVEANSKLLRAANHSLLDSSIAEVRRLTRIAVAGSDEAPSIVLGHQPEFIHAGVWAKHVVAKRLANAVGGRAINLVVDHDVPRSLALQVPAVRDSEVEVRSIALAAASSGQAYELIDPVAPSSIGQFESVALKAMGPRFGRSLIPTFCTALRERTNATCWAEQIVGSREACERSLGVAIEDAFCHALPWQPLLAEMLINADRFAAAYNEALRWYRREFRVRGEQRPIADLAVTGDAVEVAAWAYRNADQRHRVYIKSDSDSITILAGKNVIARVGRKELQSLSSVAETVSSWTPWRIRPRALTLTIFARLFLADLFIHGIGGAKYDRITDRIIENYFELLPPEMACVSATLRLDLPESGSTQSDLAAARRKVRDARWNSGRSLVRNHDPQVLRLDAQRSEALCDSVMLASMDRKNHMARREAFRRIREVVERLADLNKEQREAASSEIQRIERGLACDQLARNREFFFALHDREKLQRLLDALPAEAEFRV
ncbi:MAG: hypothetical protein HY287_01420 [Planctomycetes bacterium]|nr:hypothetical protein [Planctomycetota bacterium]MBI3832967.1 hypothetical protein [Planctomycetota bacterium]